MRTILIILLLSTFAACSSTSSLLKKDISQVAKAEYIDFTLVNTSAKSIPLIIPSVMKPNLSPDSESGVGLKIGQKIFLKHKGKKHVLLIVDNSIKNGQKLDVVQLLKERKKVLGLKS